MPDYLIRVAEAVEKGTWIDCVLKREQDGNPKRYRKIIAYFGDALLSRDFYA
ncbi:hypothetical protein C7401_13565 [Paraburkholderia unamae]|uniref:hypothetical protein n=1 Tax=Paraburkholderia unamae TaxID=219649 RepID=UPI000DC57F64|nr:hypothetical protein [Paraburkholderia unamae]RAR51902.1 hypothetical protein C7401_13565 [Paraburkholderia unamae]